MTRISQTVLAAYNIKFLWQKNSKDYFLEIARFDIANKNYDSLIKKATIYEGYLKNKMKASI